MSVDDAHEWFITSRDECCMHEWFITLCAAPWHTGFGAYHTGVEIGGTEYTFAGGAGIFSMPPRDAPGAVYRESILVGTIDSQAVLSRAIENCRGEFGPEDYNLLSR